MAHKKGTGSASHHRTVIPEMADDSSLFRSAISDAIPLRHTPQVTIRKIYPVSPVQASSLPHRARAESILGTTNSWDTIEGGDEPTYLRTGIRPDTLKKLRRGHWVVRDTLDLHGAGRDEAQLLLLEFLDDCRKRSVRCVRIIHGKGLGSPGNVPVLRGLLRAYLANQLEVLAYTQAPDNAGGSGATLVLLAP
jgi:DNA-nicking Smr family endonuclease